MDSDDKISLDIVSYLLCCLLLLDHGEENSGSVEHSVRKRKGRRWTRMQLRKQWG